MGETDRQVQSPEVIPPVPGLCHPASSVPLRQVSTVLLDNSIRYKLLIISCPVCKFQVLNFKNFKL